jgi:hypothetical protein
MKEPIPELIIITPQYKKRRLFQSLNSINEQNREIYNNAVADKGCSDSTLVMPPASYEANG